MLARVIDFSLAGYAMRVSIGLLIVSLAWRRQLARYDMRARALFVGDRLRWFIAVEHLRGTLARQLAPRAARGYVESVDRAQRATDAVLVEDRAFEMHAS